MRKWNRTDLISISISSPASSPIPTENEKSEVIVSEKELSESEIKAL